MLWVRGVHVGEHLSLVGSYCLLSCHHDDVMTIAILIPYMYQLMFDNILPVLVIGITCTVADFKCGVTFNTHGNTNGSVYPSPSTQSKMLTSRPTQMLAMVLHFLKMCVLLNQIMFVIVKNSNMLGK